MALLIVGSSVSVAGPVAFIGLLVPHLARYWIGYDLRKSLPMAMLLGAILMLAADTIARAVNFPSEVPAGAVLALIGAPRLCIICQRKTLMRTSHVSFSRYRLLCHHAQYDSTTLWIEYSPWHLYAFF